MNISSIWILIESLVRYGQVLNDERTTNISFIAMRVFIKDYNNKEYFKKKFLVIYKIIKE